MTTWREINEAIARCRRSSNPVSCLAALFERNRDGHVAAALGEEHQRLARIDDARRWFAEASRLYPKPEFKARALAALRRLGASPQAAAAPDTALEEGSTLHIIECSKQKIWDPASPSTPRFVPATQAYVGDAIRSWLADPRSATERWLILSARYGFIDPDQPIENYDVTFKNPLTGPITEDALSAQVRYQVRWIDSVPIRQFRRIVVHGHKDYFERVRATFGAFGAHVGREDERADSVGSAASLPVPTTATTNQPGAAAVLHTPTDAFTWSSDRANALGIALGQLPSQVFANFDRSEPEWPALQRLATWPHPPLACLAAICLGITDYQLGAGAAAGYWKAVMTEIERRTPSNVSNVVDLMARVCSNPVSSQLADQKLARVEKVVTAWQTDDVRSQPIELWRWLAATLGQPQEAKTVVMAMKLVDLLELSRDGRYHDFGIAIPLPIDLRIARISLTSGLIAPTGGGSISHLMSRAGDIASERRQLLIEAWRAVATAAGGLQLLRIDSLAWQLAEVASTSQWESDVAKRLIEAGSSAVAARRLAAELNWAATKSRD
jgi:N-glycosylase/DNA lyase